MIRTIAIGLRSLVKTRINLNVTLSTFLPPFRALLAEKRISLGAPLFSRSITSKVGEKATPVVGLFDSRFFAQLKLEEQRQFPDEKRLRLDFKRNHSAALELPYSKKELEEIHDDPNALLAMSKKFVIEHANRRVDLFFYTAVAYYKTAFVPTKGYTSLQHGKGRNTKDNTKLTDGCHSSFTTSLLDKTIFQNRTGREKHKSLLSGTHFMNSLNSTVELPYFVNAFDGVLETMGRQQCLNIIGDVAQETINPIEGLNLFLKMMQDILTDLKQQAILKKCSPLLKHSLMRQRTFNPELIDLVLKGTLSTTFSTQTQTAGDDYIQLLLRMTPEEKALCENNKEQVYLDKMLEMQSEILQTKSIQNIPSA